MGAHDRERGLTPPLMLTLGTTSREQRSLLWSQQSASKEEPFQGTAQSWLEWWEEVGLAGGAVPGCIPAPSAPPELSSAQDVLRSPHIPATAIGLKAPGLWSLSSNALHMFVSDRASQIL